MKSSTFALEVNGIRLGGHAWSPDGPVRAAVVIAHGMAEHGARYARFAQALAEHGVATWAVDHRGHGRTARTIDRAGHVADRGGWALLVDDLRSVVRHVRMLHPQLPLVLLGHSMGSLVARELVSQPPLLVDGLIISGAPGDAGALGGVGQVLARSQVRLRGPAHRSRLLDRLAFGSNNAAFKPARTPFDWLSGDPREVDAYLADEWCGFVCSTSFFADLLGAVSRVNSVAVSRATADALPILVVAGDADPLAKGGQATHAIVEGYRRAGVVQVTEKIYPGGRHEVLNDVMRDQVTADILGWLEELITSLDTAGVSD